MAFVTRHFFSVTFNANETHSATGYGVYKALGSEEKFSLFSKFKDLIDVSRINLRWHFATLVNNHFSQIRYLSRNRFSLFIRGPN